MSCALFGDSYRLRSITILKELLCILKAEFITGAVMLFHQGIEISHLSQPGEQMKLHRDQILGLVIFTPILLLVGKLIGKMRLQQLFPVI